MTRLSQITMAAGVCALLAAAVLFTLSFTGVIDNAYTGPPAEVVEFTPTARSVVESPEATPTQARPTPSTSTIMTFEIPRFDVSASVDVLGVGDDGVMASPDGPTSVAWYDFSARPGWPAGVDGGNAVFAGHVDYYNYGPAVFWHLKDLEQGDIIKLTMDDGTVYRYGVISRQQFNAKDAPVDTIVGHTDNEVVTLITCGGVFDRAIGEYNDRIVVRAQRIYDAPEALQAQSS